jgi:phosphomannomutase
MGVFKAYDVRGQYPSEINEELAYKIGRAFVVFTKAKEIIIGRDARLSSENLFKALSRGIVEQGADVLEIGLCGSPMFYFACAHHKKYGIMITASHLGKENNGFKLCKDTGELMYYEAGGNEVEKIVMKNDFDVSKKKGVSKKMGIIAEYKRFHLKTFWNRKKSNIKIVVDAGNMMGKFDGEILQGVCQVVPVFFSIDGSMPNRESNPLVEENRRFAKAMIKKEKADLGVVFDGDGDRVFFLDEQGSDVSPDIMLALLVKYLVKPGDSVVFDAVSSKIVEETVLQKKGIPLISKVGNPFVKRKMIESQAVIGGEISGHMFFKDSFYVECGLGVILTVIKIIDKERKPLSKIIEPLKKYFSTTDINFKVENPEKTLADAEKDFKQEAEKIIHLDGVSVFCKDFWFNLRKSNTEALVRFHLEANSKKIFEETKDRLFKIITS